MLRNYQHNIKRSLFDIWELHRSIMVQMPTGTGKTHLLAAVIYDWLRKRDTEKFNVKTVIRIDEHLSIVT